MFSEVFRMASDGLATNFRLLRGGTQSWRRGFYGRFQTRLRPLNLTSKRKIKYPTFFQSHVLVFVQIRSECYTS
jgi:hypothetical protein